MDKKDYNISRVIVVVISIVAANIIFINEDISLKLLGTFMFGIVSFVSVMLNRKICEKVINRGDTYDKWYRQVSFYTSVLLIICVSTMICMLVLGLMTGMSDVTDLGIVVIIALTGMTIPIYFISSYMHIMLILIFRRNRKNY